MPYTSTPLDSILSMPHHQYNKESDDLSYLDQKPKTPGASLFNDKGELDVTQEQFIEVDDRGSNCVGSPQQQLPSSAVADCGVNDSPNKDRKTGSAPPKVPEELLLESGEAEKNVS